MAIKGTRRAEVFKHSLLLFVLFFAFFPLVIMLAISFKDQDQFYVNPYMFDWPTEWRFENWARGWNTVKNAIANSVVTSVGAVVGAMVMAILTSYALARYRFPGRGIIYYGIIGSMFLPGTAATLVTTFNLIRNLNLFNSLWALVITGAVGGQVVSVFILKQFIEDIPRELFESAQIDGAGHLHQIMHIIIPLSGSILGTLAILKFLGTWNNLMLPLIAFRDEELYTIPVKLMHLEGDIVKEWGPLMAGYAIASIPLVLLFVFTMRLFVKGIAAGAIKG